MTLDELVKLIRLALTGDARSKVSHRDLGELNTYGNGPHYRCAWHCKFCDIKLDVNLNHVDPAPRPTHGCSDRCPGTFDHPKHGPLQCSARGKELSHAGTRMKVTRQDGRPS